MKRLAWMLLGWTACGSSSSVGTPDARPAVPDAAAMPDAYLVQTGTLVTLADGKLQGEVAGTSRRFLGIPFAKPPVGELRWKAPVKNDPWTGVRDATKFGARCAQLTTLQFGGSDAEDCLYLNVWVPEPAPTRPLPVMFWIHGGGNESGSASDPVPLGLGDLFYDGRGLAEKYGVVVVTTNYRLGPLGFYYDPDIGAPGNQGLLDQGAAMQWVQANISTLGGDPGNVTIFGQSAGSWDVCYHMVAPGSAGLFQRALSESGGCTTRTPTKAEAAASAAAFHTGMGCAAAGAGACLRAKTVDDVLTPAPVDGGPASRQPGGDFYQGGTPRWWFGVFVDGDVLPDQPRALFDGGHAAKVPYLLGSTADEGTLFHIGAVPVADEAQYRAALGRVYPAAAIDAIVNLYPVASFASADAALERVTGDSRFVCPTHDVARRAAAAGLTVRMYNFGLTLPIPALQYLHATHGAEIAFVFDSVDDPLQATLGDAIRGYWSRFAAGGDPNGAGALVWPTFSAASDVRVDFNSAITVVTGFRDDQCAFWRTLYDADYNR